MQMRRVRLESRACQQAFAKCRAWRELRLLLNEGDSQSIAPLNFAVVELRQPRDDAQERGFPGAVATDQANALTGADCQLSAIEKRPVAKGEMGVEQGDE
jgi:hypothetical protein